MGFKLKKKLRANSDELDFAKCLLCVGNGEYPRPEGEPSGLPINMIAEKSLILKFVEKTLL